jgi:transposase-like protein
MSQEVGQVIAMGVLPSGDDPATAGRVARSPRRYDDSFRRYAVKRAREPDVRLTDVASELGVSASTLRRWVKAAAPEDPPHESPEESLRYATPEMNAPLPAAAPALLGAAPALLGAAPALLGAAPALLGEAAAGTAGRASTAGTARATGHDEHHVLAVLDAILDMFPRQGALPLEADLSEPGPAAHREVEPVADRIPLHPGDDIFPSLSSLLPAYRFPIILTGLLAALWLSTVVPATYALRPVAQSLHVLSLVVAFGAVLVIDWHGLLWLAGRRGLTESTRLAAGAGPLIWGGLAGLIATGALLHPNLHSPLTVTKLVLVLAVAWNGAAMSALRRRMAQLPAYVKPVDLPPRDWRLMMTATVISQIGWWGAIIIGFVNSSR